MICLASARMLSLGSSQLARSGVPAASSAISATDGRLWRAPTVSILANSKPPTVQTHYDGGRVNVPAGYYQLVFDLLADYALKTTTEIDVRKLRRNSAPSFRHPGELSRQSEGRQDRAKDPEHDRRRAGPSPRVLLSCAPGAKYREEILRRLLLRGDAGREDGHQDGGSLVCRGRRIEFRPSRPPRGPWQSKLVGGVLNRSVDRVRVRLRPGEPS